MNDRREYESLLREVVALREESRGRGLALDEVTRQNGDYAREVERQRQEMSRLRDDVRALEADKANLEWRLKGVQSRVAELERERDELMRESTLRVVLPAQDFDRIQVEVDNLGRASPTLRALAERHGKKPPP